MTVEQFHSVLVVEDDQETRQNLCDILNLDGYRVESTTTVKGVLTHDRLDEFSVIILDRKLPDGTAYELLPILRKIAPQTSVTIATDFADLDDAIMALRHGASDYILKPINVDLLRASMMRCRQLKEAQRRAVEAERLAAVGTVVASVAHESRNALQRIRARVDLIRLGNETNQELCADLAAIEEASEQLRLHFDELREFSARIVLQRKICDLPSLAQRAWETVQIGRDHPAAEIAVPQENFICYLDPIRIEQVFRNLFENSIAACRDPAKIDVSWSRTRLHGQEVSRIICRDNGPGFTRDQRRQVFEPFFTTKEEGTGLGLAICKRIIEAHGGSIGIADSSGHGATTVIVLPTYSESIPPTSESDALQVVV
jgi:signal transduction histidine kinase